MVNLDNVLELRLQFWIDLSSSKDFGEIFLHDDV